MPKKMLKSNLKVINQLGLHARAAAQLVKLATKFKSKIILKRLEKNLEADAKSILSVLTLAAAKGINLEIEIDGKDENEALQAIQELFERGFGEN
jgi:phosphocarrier protein HPr